MIPPTYDSMIAKLIVHGKDRAEAIAKCAAPFWRICDPGIDTNLISNLILSATRNFVKEILIPDLLKSK